MSKGGDIGMASGGKDLVYIHMLQKRLTQEKQYREMRNFMLV